MVAEDRDPAAPGLWNGPGCFVIPALGRQIGGTQTVLTRALGGLQCGLTARVRALGKAINHGVHSLPPLSFGLAG